MEAIRESPPNVLISDLVVPGVSSVELAVEFRKRYPHCKITLFPEHVDASVLLEDANRSGPLFLVYTKPIPPDRLLARIRGWRERGLDKAQSWI